MSLEVKWYDETHRILLGTIAKDTTWSDYHDAVDRMVYEASQCKHQVDVIFYDEVGMPPGNPLPHVRKGIAKLAQQENIGISIIAGSRGSSGFVRAIFEAVGKMFGGRPMASGSRFGGFAKTLDEAVTKIYKQRANLQHTV